MEICRKSHFYLKKKWKEKRSKISCYKVEIKGITGTVTLLQLVFELLTKLFYLQTCFYLQLIKLIKLTFLSTKEKFSMNESYDYLKVILNKIQIG